MRRRFGITRPDKAASESVNNNQSRIINHDQLRRLRFESLESRRLLTCNSLMSTPDQLLPDDPGFLGQWGLHNTGQLPQEWDGSAFADVAGSTGGSDDADTDTPEAWARYGTGSTSVVVAVNDSGVDYTHPDLYKNIWINQGELPPALVDGQGIDLEDTDGDGLITFWDLNDPSSANNTFLTSDFNANGYIDAGDILNDNWFFEDGVDNDGNGYPDDLIGWDFLSTANNGLGDNDPFSDEHYHGTHVSGIIGAVGDNNEGVTGVNWKSQLMINRIFAPGFGDETAKASAALDYAADLKEFSSVNVLVTNNSYGLLKLASDVQDLSNAIQRHEALEILFVTGAGNSNFDIDVTFPVGDLPIAPAVVALFPNQFPFGNIIAVASTDNVDMKANSNYGIDSVDLSAPGDSILSTMPLVATPSMTNLDTEYDLINGTSQATPHVAGVAALAWSAFPDATMQEVRDAILASVDVRPQFEDLWVTEGRLNAFDTLRHLDTPRVERVTISGPNTNDGNRLDATGNPAPDGHYDVPSGTGDQIRTIPIGGANKIEVEFSEDVNIDGTELSLIGQNIEHRYYGSNDLSTALQFTGFDSFSNVATWMLDTGQFNSNQYELRIDDAVTDLDGNRLDGDWTNPTALSNCQSNDFGVTISTFPSGNGIAGGDFVFNTTILKGDFNADNMVDVPDDGFIFSAFVGLGDRYTEADSNGDGVVTTPGDGFVLVSEFGLDFREWPIGTTIFLDFGAGIGFNTDGTSKFLNSTVGEIRNINGIGSFGSGGTGPPLSAPTFTVIENGIEVEKNLLFNDNPHDTIPDIDHDVLLSPFDYDFNNDGITKNDDSNARNNDLDLLSHEVRRLVEKTLAPFDINVELSALASTDLTAVSAFMDPASPNGAPAGSAYVLLTDLSSTFGAPGISPQRFERSSAGLGNAATDDINQLGSLFAAELQMQEEQLDDLLAVADIQGVATETELAVVYIRNIKNAVTDNLLIEHSASFDAQLTTLLANGAAHEGLHTLGMQHPLINQSLNAIPATIVYTTDEAAVGDLMDPILGDRNDPTDFADLQFLSRAFLPADFIGANLNNHEYLARLLTALNASGNGLNDDIEYITGTGLHDRISIVPSATFPDHVNITVETFSDPELTMQYSYDVDTANTFHIDPKPVVFDQDPAPNQFNFSETITIDLGELPQRRVIINTGHGDDLVEIDARITANFEIRGGAGNDQLEIKGMNNEPSQLLGYWFEGGTGDDTLTIDQQGGGAPHPDDNPRFVFDGSLGTNNIVVLPPPSPISSGGSNDQIPTYDFDTDGDVDGADFLAWQRAYVTTNSTEMAANNLANWRIAYGEKSNPPTEFSIRVSNVILIDPSLALEWSTPSSDESISNFVYRRIQYQVSTVSSDTETNSIPAKKLAKQSNMSTKTAIESDRESNNPWLDEELLERIFG